LIKALFRVDSSPQIGLGHLMRCLALADALKNYKVKSIFVMAGDEPGGKAIVLKRKHQVIMINSLSAGEECVFLNRIIENELPGAVVLDGYNFNYDYQIKINTKGAPLVCLGWSSDYRTAADIAINQNIWASPDLYAGQVKPGATLLLGTRYAMLPQEYRHRKNEVRRNCEHILITLGGGKYSRLALSIYEMLRDLPYYFTVVLGPYSDETTARGNGNLEIIKSRDSLYSLLRETDLAITAGGSTIWELCCLGVPFITYILSDNQEQNATALHESGVTINMGWISQLDQESLRQTITLLAGNYEQRASMAQRGQTLVDGFGADRVAKTIVDFG
jgi:UDP-2,4-diacetamido-2,4,6-trideoxy-beta-L-altropyranose hydrolase